VYEDDGGRPRDVAGPAPATRRGRPIKALLRLEVRSVPGAEPPSLPQSGNGKHRSSAAPEVPQSFAILADRLTIEPGCLSLWHAGELVFRSPIAALISIAFGMPPGPPPPPAAEPALPESDPEASPAGHAGHAVADEQPEGPRGEPHRDLSSANTRWTRADEHRLVELHSAGVPIDELARRFGRRKGAVRARLFKLRHAAGSGSETSTSTASVSVDRPIADRPITGAGDTREDRAHADG
jgi:hypothetical protein